MSAHLLAIATNVPTGGMTQSQAAKLAAQVAGSEPRRARAIEILYERSGIHRRGLVVADEQGQQHFFPQHANEKTPTTAARMAAYVASAATLALPACHNALEQARVKPGEVTHIIVASCTGFDAPGVDQTIIRELGLPRSVRRTIVGFMGCHAAINALAVAAAFVNTDPAAVVLVCCVEICSLHFSYTDEADHALANALFADGAAAAVIASATRDATRPAPTLRASASTIIPDSADCMAWHIGDHGFTMNLSSRVPDILAASVPPWIDAFLERHNLTRHDIQGWAIHPGGPRVVTAIQKALNLPDNAGDASLGVLRDNGNMSSPTVLFILDQLWRSNTPRPWLAMAFGPGLAGEAALFA